MDIVELLMEGIPLLYFVGIGCVVMNGEYGKSDSRTG